MSERFHLELDVYGVTVGIHSSNAVAGEQLGEDFAHFRVEPGRPQTEAGGPLLTLWLHHQPPPYGEVPAKVATVYTPRNVSFVEGGRTYIDYSGRALAVLQGESGRLDVYSQDAELLYEVGYLFLLSQVGERMDERGLHRVHALGISVEGRAGLVLLPMGGGKSTLATHLLSPRRQVRLLSDDSPIVDRQGRLHAFPLRIGILPGDEAGYRPDQLRTIQRMEFGPKLLLRHELFAERVAADAAPGVVFVGRRSLSAGCEIVPATRLAALWALIPNCVIGLGLFQGMEFVFNRDARELGRKARVAFSRLRNCVALVRRSQTVTVVLGRDLERNADAILGFLQRTAQR